MEIRPEIAWLVLGCALVTALPRVLPLVALSRFELPAPIADWLRHVPVAVLSALLCLEMTAFDAKGVLAIAAAFLVGAGTRSLLGTVAAGVAVFWMLL